VIFHRFFARQEKVKRGKTIIPLKGGKKIRTQSPKLGMQACACK
jgi:hypothetical protein